jgi:aspartyl-tRNA(Asn)/glutamyl-tRNA(Gln) amidotransferase subunit A
MRRTSAAALAKDLREGRIDPLDLVDQVFARLAEIGDAAIFTQTLRPRAEAEARAARERLRAGNPASLLDGVPVAWKDLYDLKGRVTTAGSVVLASNPPAAQDAALVHAGARAGLVSVGALNMTEFAYSGIGLNPHYGTPRNPNGTGPARAPGGSSSASGVVVANDIVPIAFGTDTGGSIRIPAAFNGVVGYKSSTGHYPMGGVFPLSHTLDTLGPLAHTVEDCVLADTVLRGLQKPDVGVASVAALDFVIPDAVMLDTLAPAVAANFDAAVARLEAAGARIRRLALPELTQALELITHRAVLAAVEALDLHWDRVHGPDAARMDARVVRRIMNAAQTSAVDLSILLRERVRLIAEVTNALGNALLICPTTPTVAMPIAPLEADQEVFFRHNGQTLRNTSLGNFLDWCGLSIPNGLDADAMPTGFLISAPHGQDRAVLAAGLAVEHIVRGT